MWPIQLEILYSCPTLFYFFLFLTTEFNTTIFFCFKKGNISRTVLRTMSNIQMFDKVLIRLDYQTTCFKLEEITWRLTEHEGTGPRAGTLWPGKSNREDTDKTSNATAKKTNYNTKSITYSEMFNYLSICRLTKNVLTLSINY